MLYLAIDQHAKQITVCVRNHDGDTVLRRQVSTRPEKIEAFFQQLTERDTQFMAILEVCGFNDRLLDVLRKWKCQEIVLIHPDRPSARKTDRRDAQKLADLLLAQPGASGGRPDGSRPAASLPGIANGTGRPSTHHPAEDARATPHAGAEQDPPTHQPS